MKAIALLLLLCCGVASVSGKPYLVKCAGAATVNSKPWFTEKLVAFRKVATARAGS